MKRLLTAFLLFVLLFCLCACDDVNTEIAQTDNADQAILGKVESTTHIETEVAPYPSTFPSEVPTTAPITVPTTEPPHIHSFKAATCTAPKTCKSCGETEGSKADHSWTDATCNAPQKCRTCDAKKGTSLGHNYKNGTCTRCGSKDPAYNNITYILNTHTKKFHYTSCSRLPTDNRKDTTLSRDAIIDEGYTPCGYCDP